MPVRVQITPVLRKYAPDYDEENGILLDNATGLSVRRITELLNIPAEEVMTVVINGYPARLNSVVNDGDVVSLIKIMGGG